MVVDCIVSSNSFGVCCGRWLGIVSQQNVPSHITHSPSFFFFPDGCVVPFSFLNHDLAFLAFFSHSTFYEPSMHVPFFFR